MANTDFVHLHLHTQYSLLDGAIRISDLVARAKEFKMPAVAITDHGNLFGAMEFYSQVQAAGIKPIVGCEVYVAPGSRKKQSASAGEITSHHLVLLCENEKGYRNLCKLVTSGYLEGFYYKPRIDAEILEQWNEGLICLSGCLSGEIPSKLVAGDEEGALKKARWFRDLFGPDRYFLELQENGLEAQRKANRGLIELSKKLELKVVATNDSHYLREEDYRAHEALLCIQTGKKLSDPDRLRFETNEYYFKSPEEMAHQFAEIPEAVTNTRLVAERCSLLLEFGQTHMPRFELTGGRSLRDEFQESAREGFKERVAEGVKRGEMTQDRLKEYEDRLELEIELIQQMGFSGYFLIVADFINYARDNGIPVGPGRGSAAGSLAAYSLGITDIDPIRYNLLFERFLNPERKSMPDIDVDFCMDRRDEVIDYVSRKYGKANVAQIITFGRMQAKAVVRDVARVLGLPYSEADRIAKLIPDELKMTLDKAIDKEPKLKEEIDTNSEVRDLITTARALEGLTRHSSTHAAGIVLADRPLVDYLPLYRGSKGETITQFDMTWVERIGLVKFDFLGLKTLTVIQKALGLLKDRGEELDLSAIPLDDEATYRLLTRGDTLGVFQLESSGMREMLTKFKPTVFEDLIAILALYRPGPLDSGMVDDFINRKHGLTKIEYPLPELEPILKETYGVIVYQEQVMKIAQVLAGYSLGDADLLRRAMGKKKPEEMREQKKRFEKGAEKNKIDPKKATAIFDLMEKFAGYGFNKSHSAAYAMVSYHTAYLKTHFPAEFLAAQLTCDAGNTDKVTVYISECRDRDIKVLPPHVNNSLKDFNVVGGEVVFGLSAVKNVGNGAIQSILETRAQKGPFCDLFDFTRRVDLRKVNKKVLESLIKCGAFDEMGSSRRAMMEALDTVIETGQSLRREKEQGQFNLFDTACVPMSPTSADSLIPEVAEWDDAMKLSFEKDLLGFYVTGHPLERHAKLINRYTNANTSTLGKIPANSAVKIAGIVKSKKEINTRKGDRMAFVTIEDMYGAVETTALPDVYIATRDLLQSKDPLLISGVREGEADNPRILVNEVYRLEDVPRLLSNSIAVRISTAGASTSQIGAIKRILTQHRGRIPVRLHVVIPNKTETIISLPSFRCDPTEAMLTEMQECLGYPPVTFE